MIEKRVRSPADNLTCSGALQTQQRDNLVAAIIAKSGNLHLVRALLELGPSSSHWLPVAGKINSPADIMSDFVESRLRLLHYTDARAKIWTEAGIAVASFFEWGFTEQLLLVAMQEYIEKCVGSHKVSGEFVDREVMNNVGMNVVSFILSLLEPLLLIRIEMDAIIFQVGSIVYCDSLQKYSTKLHCSRIIQAMEDEAESKTDKGTKMETSKSEHEYVVLYQKLEQKYLLIRGDACLSASFSLDDFGDSGRPNSLKSFSIIRCIQKMKNWDALKSYFRNALHVDSAISSGCGSALAQLINQAYFSESASIISELNTLMDSVGDLAVSSLRATIPACLNLSDTCDLCKSAASSLVYLKDAMLITAEDIKQRKSMVSPYCYDPLSKFSISIRRQAHKTETYMLCKYPGVWKFMSLLPWCLHYNKPRSQDTMRNGFPVSLVGVLACSELSDPRYFVVACRDGTISAWNVISGAISSQFKVKCCPSSLHSQSGTNGGGNVAVGCEDGSLIAFAAVALRNGESFSLKAPHTKAKVVHDSQVTGVAWYSPNQLLSCSFDGLVKSWTTISEGIFGDLTLSLNKSLQLDDHLTCLTTCAPGRFPIFACAGLHGVIRICRSDFMDERSTLYGHTGNITALNFNSKGTALVSCSSDGCVRLWSGATSREWRHIGELSYSSAAEPFFSAAITGSGGNKVVAGSKFGPIFIWTVPSEPYKFGNVNTKIGHLTGRLTGHIMRVDCIQTLSDLSGVTSCSTDGTLRIWNVKYESSGTKEIMQAEHTRKVVMLHIAFMPEYGVLSLGHPSQLSPGVDSLGTEILPFIKTCLAISTSGASDCKFWDFFSEVCIGSILTTDGGIVFGKIFNRTELLVVATDKGAVLLFSLTPTPPADSKSTFTFRSNIIGRTKLFNCGISCGEIDRTESFLVMGSTKGHVKVLALPDLIEIMSFKRVVEAKISRAEQLEKRAQRRRQPKDAEKALDIGVLNVSFSTGADIVVAVYEDLVVATWKVSSVEPIMLSPICPYSNAPKTTAFIGLHALCPFGIVPVGAILQFWRLGLQCKFEFCLRLVNRSAKFTCCCFSHDASYLVTGLLGCRTNLETAFLTLFHSGSDDGRLLIWNLYRKEVVGSFQCQASPSFIHSFIHSFIFQLPTDEYC
jgi:WD40 repeat protein